MTDIWTDKNDDSPHNVSESNEKMTIHNELEKVRVDIEENDSVESWVGDSDGSLKRSLGPGCSLQ